MTLPSNQQDVPYYNNFQMFEARKAERLALIAALEEEVSSAHDTCIPQECCMYKTIELLEQKKLG